MPQHFPATVPTEDIAADKPAPHLERRRAKRLKVLKARAKNRWASLIKAADDLAQQLVLGGVLSDLEIVAKCTNEGRRLVAPQTVAHYRRLFCDG